MDELRRGNLTAALTGTPTEEGLEDLVSKPGVRIERIVSWGQGTSAGVWYDQGWMEWVLLVQGEATLELEGRTGPMLLAAGDWVLIPAHCRHRVVRTAAEGPTIWLAVHVGPGPAVNGLAVKGPAADGPPVDGPPVDDSALL